MAADRIALEAETRLPRKDVQSLSMTPAKALLPRDRSLAALGTPTLAGSTAGCRPAARGL